MKDDIRTLVNEIASHPVTYGLAAAVARWVIGDREGGVRSLLGYIVASTLVAWAVNSFLVDEGLTQARSAFWVLLAAFVARDMLVALAAMAAQFRADPINLALRVWYALRGGRPK